MRITTAFLAHELRTQARSLRFRAFAAAYVGAGAFPAILIYVRRDQIGRTIGAAAYAYETFGVLPLLTGVLAVLLSLDGITREQGGGAWTTVTLNGLTSAGYLLRRWLALQATILPLTALPVLAAAGLALAAGHEIPTPAVFWGPWLVHILPLAFLGASLGLGLGTLGGGGMSTFVVAAVAIFLVPDLANGLLARLGYRFAPLPAWLDIRSLGSVIQRLNAPFDSEGRLNLFPSPASEAGYDLGTAAEQSLAEGTLLAVLAVATLGLSTAWLRRTRPDIRPRKVRPDHPLRSFLAVFGRVRERLVPDPAPAPADRLAFALVLLLAAGLAGVALARAHHYDGLAWRREQAETSGGPAPTSWDVVPGRWRIAGRLGPGAEVSLRVAAELRNEGKGPCRRLAFQLNPYLDLEESGMEGGRIRTRRSWNRLEVEIEPPIPPGERRELRFRLRGRPAAAVFPEGPWSGTARLQERRRFFGGHQQARFSRDLVDYSQSYQVPAISGYRIDLGAGDLTPLPRYGTWALDEGAVPPEVFFPEAQLELSLAVPPGLFLADSCGGVARGGRLASRCKLALGELAVVGGRHRLLETAGDAAGATVAVFPSHRAAGELHLGFLARGARRIADAWPGAGGLESLVVLEWPDESIHQRHSNPMGLNRYFDLEEGLVDVRGRLVFVREIDLLRSEPMRPEHLVAEVVASRLLARRPLASDQQLFFRQLVHSLALERQGLGSTSGAVVMIERLSELEWIRTPALRPETWGYWRTRFPALVAALEERTGAEPLRASVDELLSRGDPPGTFEEFAEILKRRSERPVDGMIRDFFLAGKLPQLNLEEVRFRRTGDGWRATGRVHNLADGEVECRVELATDIAPSETTVVVGTGESVPFALETRYRPQGVFLDPDSDCHRVMLRAGTLDRVYFKGETR